MSTEQFGGWLRDAREARGLSVQAIALQTKIPSRHLEALERGEALGLPVFYQRAEVRAVARTVGLDEQLAIARLEAEQAPAEPQLSPPATPSHVTSAFVVALIGTVMVVVGLAAWSSFERLAASGNSAANRAPVTAPLLDASASIEVPAPSIETPAPSLAESVGATEVAPTAPVGPTELLVRTEPAGARVTVNGVGWGASPLTIRHVEAGEKRVRVTMDGYAAAERSVILDEGRRETLSIRLSPANAGS